MNNTDFLIIGSGIAGLSYALEVARFGRVTVLSKADFNEGNTLYAQGGIASVTGEGDSFESHIADTLAAGGGLCHPDIVRLVVTEGPATIQWLLTLGANFDREDATHFKLGREGGHSERRILHSRDRTGAELQRALIENVLRHPNITVLPNHLAVDFITEKRGSKRDVVGAYALDRKSGAVTVFGSKITLLATGGAGKVYLYTSNPDVATGDGIAMAYRAGAEIGNMEFFQFHPTCLYHPEAKSFLLTEALRGEGAVLLTPAGKRFMPDYDARAELAPRDVVARAIDDQMKRHGFDYVLLDISFRERDFLRTRFPNICETVERFGFDLTRRPVPVVPAAHYCCGGVVSDSWGRTNLGRLFVAGEVACTGLHGANRLASNSLLEAVVFARRAASESVRMLSGITVPSSLREWDPLDTIPSAEAVLVSYNWDEVRRLMWNLVGISRSDRRLELARHRIDLIRNEVKTYYWRYQVTSDLVELRNILDMADVIVRSASLRQESRGLHHNTDWPERDDARFLADTVVRGETVAFRPLVGVKTGGES